MKVFFLRHGKAEDSSQNSRDDDRKLTKSGIAEIRALGAKLKEMGQTFDAIFTSPMLRAYQTAVLIAETLDLEEDLSEMAELASGVATKEDIRKKMREWPKAQNILFVGHMPDLGQILSALADEKGNASFRPGTLIGISFQTPDSPKGRIFLRLDSNGN